MLESRFGLADQKTGLCLDDGESGKYFLEQRSPCAFAGCWLRPLCFALEYNLGEVFR
jgi:hypothetical protein